MKLQDLTAITQVVVLVSLVKMQLNNRRRRVISLLIITHLKISLEVEMIMQGQPMKLPTLNIIFTTNFLVRNLKTPQIRNQIH